MNNNNKPRVLHIDDDINFLQAFSTSFREHLSCVNAKNVEEAVKLLNQEKIELVVLDYQISGLNGLDVFKSLKAVSPNIPVIFYSSQGDETIVREIFTNGAADYFVKDLMSFAQKEKLLNSISKNIEKHKAEKALANTELKFQKLFNNANDIIFLHSATLDPRSCHFIEVNEVACKTLGYTHDELLKMSPADFYLHKDNTTICRDMEKVIENGCGSFEIIHKCKDGRELFFEINAHYFELHGENVILSIARDITKRKAVEEELRKSREKYRHLVEDISDIIFSINKDGDFLYLNPVIGLLTGDSPDELIGKNIAEIIHKDDIQHVKEVLKNGFEGNDFEMDFRVMNPHQEILWLRAQGSPIFEGSKFICFRGVAREITSKKRKEENLKVLNKSLEKTINDHNIWLHVIDPRENVVKWNRTAERISGYKKEEIMNNGTFWKNMFPDAEEREKAQRKMSLHLYENTNIKEFEGTIVDKKGSRKVISWVCRSLKDERDKFLGTLCVGSDLTGYRKLEYSNKQISKELKDIIYLVSHDFRGPLSMINAYISEINREPSLASNYCCKILQQSTYLMSFLDDLLRLSRSINPLSNKMRINLETLIRKTICAYNNENFDISLNFETQLPLVFGDFIRMEQVFKIIIENAVQNRNTLNEKLELSLGEKRTQNSIIFYMKDNGKGIRKEYIDNVFNLGFSAGVRKSRGLGLSIAKRIIEIHNGRIWLESDGLNRGTRVLIEFPKEITSHVMSKR